MSAVGWVKSAFPRVAGVLQGARYPLNDSPGNPLDTAENRSPRLAIEVSAYDRLAVPMQKGSKSSYGRTAAVFSKRAVFKVIG
jgi:hypothetical protein